MTQDAFKNRWKHLDRSVGSAGGLRVWIPQSTWRSCSWETRQTDSRTRMSRDCQGRSRSTVLHLSVRANQTAIWMKELWWSLIRDSICWVIIQILNVLFLCSGCLPKLCLFTSLWQNELVINEPLPSINLQKRWKAAFRHRRGQGKTLFSYHEVKGLCHNQDIVSNADHYYSYSYSSLRCPF